MKTPAIRTESELTALSAAKLAAYRDAWDGEESACCDALIAAGRGHEKAGITRAKAKDGDPLAVRWCVARDAAMAAYSEIADRKRFHGSDKPIRRRVAT